MHISLDRTLILLIDHKDIMFRLIDYMDQFKRKDLPAEVFYNSINAKITSLTSGKEVERLREAFDLNNFLKTGIVSEFNKSRGTIAFQPAIIEIFRLFDKERIRGMKKAEFENIRIQLLNELQQHQDVSFDRDNIQFLEQRDHLFDLLRQINSQIQNNTSHLEHEADRLSKRLDGDGDILTLDESRQYREMLEQVKQVYNREIIPTLEFLNEKEYSKTRPPLTLIDDIRKLYDSRGFEDDSYYIDQYKLSILSHYKVVEKVKQALQRYVQQEREHRLAYNAIEQAYLKLQELAKSSFTENLKEKYIFKSIEQQEAIYFEGLKSHANAQETRIEWLDRNHVIYFNEYLIAKNAHKRSETSATVTTFSDKKTDNNQHNSIKRKIKALIENAHTSPPIEDIYLFIHNLLAEGLDKDYHIKYILYGVSCFKHKHGKRFKVQVSFAQPLQRIQHQSVVLEYNKREYIQWLAMNSVRTYTTS